MNRLTTGTPPRIDGSTIDFSDLDKQESDDPAEPLSFLNWNKGVSNKDRLVPCYRTFTNHNTHEVVRQNSHLLPKFIANEGKGVGPRYCFLSFIFYIFALLHKLASTLTSLPLSPLCNSFHFISSSLCTSLLFLTHFTGPLSPLS
jgi:hypothetical protein